LIVVTVAAVGSAEKHSSPLVITSSTYIIGTIGSAHIGSNL